MPWTKNFRRSFTSRTTRILICTHKRFPGSRTATERSIKLQPDKTYVRPSGYKVRMEKPPGANRAWRLVGTRRKALLCHKPCTVSGGGKSEISKPITDAILTGPVFVADFKKDFDQVAELIHRDYSGRFLDPATKRFARSAGAGTFAGFGHQTAHAGHARVQSGLQRLARDRSAICQGTGLRREALLQARMGR